MHRSPSRVGILALLLVVIFLGAQFHFCWDLGGGPASSHICPICSTTAFALAPRALLLASIAASHRLESRVYGLDSTLEIPRAISPRAPPSRKAV
jgi:hypothetical protein